MLNKSVALALVFVCIFWYIKIIIGDIKQKFLICSTIFGIGLWIIYNKLWYFKSYEIAFRFCSGN